MKSCTMRKVAAAGVLVVASLTSTLPAQAAGRPDDRAGARGPGLTGIRAVRPDDRAGIRGPATAARPAPTSVRFTASGFDWSSGGIGAAAGAGSILALLGAFLLVRSRRVAPQVA
jgi:hypothetical protein